MIKDILRGFGFTEVYNYSFITKEDAKTYGLKDNICLVNPSAEDQNILRSSLIPNLTKNWTENAKHTNDIRIFEIGDVFESPDKEKKNLAAMISRCDFYQGKGIQRPIKCPRLFPGAAAVDDPESLPVTRVK